MSNPRELILIINEIQSLQKVNWVYEGYEGFTLTMRTGNIQSIKFISETVLEITFESGKLLVEMRKAELEQIKYEE